VGWVVAKGGITSHDLLSRAFDVGVTTVVGQARPGIVPVLEIESGARRRPFLIFPGNVHGRTAAPVRIRLDLLGALAEAVKVPLVLHGVSGIDGDVLVAACRPGVAKFNVNADLRAAYLTAVTDWAGEPPGDDLVGALRVARRRVAGVLTDLIAVLDPPRGRSPRRVGRSNP